MGIPVFLSHPAPHLNEQQEFLDGVIKYLTMRGFDPRTLGRQSYDMDCPLASVRRLMLESNGVIVLAFQRYYVKNGTVNHGSTITNRSPRKIDNMWMTSPWCHIETAMGYQLGLPLLIFREKGVMADGVLQNGIIGTYLPEFDLSLPISDYFASAEWQQLIAQWEGRVRTVREKKGLPQLY